MGCLIDLLGGFVGTVLAEFFGNIFLGILTVIGRYLVLTQNTINDIRKGKASFGQWLLAPVLIAGILVMLYGVIRFLVFLWPYICRLWHVIGKFFGFIADFYGDMLDSLIKFFEIFE
ncbi:MAG: hypothetical protein MJZ31_02840 [Bacteroidales bacterium]|nr:hypothetical protein [Bacteroidales bacterium]